MGAAMTVYKTFIDEMINHVINGLCQEIISIEINLFFYYTRYFELYIIKLFNVKDIILFLFLSSSIFF